MIKLSDIVYLGIRLLPSCRKVLIQNFLDEVTDLAPWGKIYCDHITYQYGDAITVDGLSLVGTTKHISTGVHFVKVDGKVIYIPVQVNGVENAHITVATNGMVAPVEAGVHLSEHPYKGEYVESTLMCGTMCAYLKDGTIVDKMIL